MKLQDQSFMTGDPLHPSHPPNKFGIWRAPGMNVRGEGGGGKLKCDAGLGGPGDTPALTSRLC